MEGCKLIQHMMKVHLDIFICAQNLYILAHVYSSIVSMFCANMAQGGHVPTDGVAQNRLESQQALGVFLKLLF